MLKTHTLLFLFFFLLLPSAKSQNKPKLYDDMCDILQSVYCDYVRNEAEIRYLSGNGGQYIGQFIENKIYGWGYYLSDDGSQMFGQFRNGKLLFGITVSKASVRVGSENYFTEYDLQSGEIERVQTPGGILKMSVNDVENLKFGKVNYTNGDAYFGEIQGGKRSGYGVYYWSNGDFWYGKYEDGYREGYGVLIKSDRKLFFGKWIGDKKTE